jgi:hypothetical protein
MGEKSEAASFMEIQPLSPCDSILIEALSKGSLLPSSRRGAGGGVEVPNKEPSTFHRPIR